MIQRQHKEVRQMLEKQVRTQQTKFVGVDLPGKWSVTPELDREKKITSRSRRY